jgi:hypothetical protein
MGTNRLAELLHDAADPVGAPQLAERAWVRAGQVRRRRVGVASGVGAALAVAGVLAAVALPGDTTAPPIVATSTTPTDGAPVIVPPSVDRITGPLGERAISPLPVRDFRPVNPVRLSQQTMDRAVALYQPVNPDDDGVRPVYALSSGGTWYELDVLHVTYIRDQGGNRATPLRVTSLSPNGKYAAIPQADTLVTVDLTTGRSSSINLPGFNEHVLWRGNDTLIVGGDTNRYRVDRETRLATKLPTGASIWDIVADQVGGGNWLELPATGFNGGEEEALKLREWRLEQSEPVGQRTISPALLRPNGVDDWYGRGWRNPGAGDLVVRGGFGRTEKMFGLPVVAVVDLRGNRVARLLPLEGERNKVAGEALGWLDSRTALLRLDPEGLVAWDVTTGDLRVVSAGPLGGMLAVQLS